MINNARCEGFTSEERERIDRVDQRIKAVNKFATEEKALAFLEFLDPQFNLREEAIPQGFIMRAYAVYGGGWEELFRKLSVFEDIPLNGLTSDGKTISGEKIFWYVAETFTVRGASTANIRDGVYDIMVKHPMEMSNLLNDLIVETTDLIKQRLGDRPHYLEKEFRTIQEMFGLSNHEVRYLRGVHLLSLVENPFLVLYSYSQLNDKMSGAFAQYVGVDVEELKQIKNKLVELSLLGYGDAKVFPTEILQTLVHKGRAAAEDLFFSVPEPESLPLDNHMVDAGSTNYAKSILSSGHDEPIHILLWGPPGTGKSSYARALLQDLNTRALLVKHGDSKNSNSQVSVSLKTSLTVAMNDVASGGVCVVDDADDLLGTSASFINSGESRSRIWLHNLLETPHTKMIWIVNTTSNIDPSVKRRFAFNIYFPPLHQRQREEIWKNVLKYNGLSLPTDQIATLAKQYEFSPGVISKNVKCLSLGGISVKDTLFGSISYVLDSYRTLHHGGVVTKVQRDSEKFIEQIGISTQVAEIVSDLKRFDQFLRGAESTKNLPIRNRSLLFHGVSGSGKTELANYISDRVGRPLVRKLASDILSMWVGGTEQNIKEAYAEAERKEGILFIDEADSLLFDRGSAQRSWEVTQVNEMLARMEDFVGIQIYATNRLDEMDLACLRRFSHKIEFTYLSPEQCPSFYEHFFGRSLSGPEKQKLLKIGNLVPGDFYVVKNQFFFKEDCSNSELIDGLLEESRLKKDRQKKPVGFTSTP